MSVDYEWDVEVVSASDTEDLEVGEVIDHRHQDSYAAAAALASTEPEPGQRYMVVLVRDDDDGRSWAYVKEGLLPSHFTDALGHKVAPVPSRFVKEVAKATGEAA